MASGVSLPPQAPDEDRQSGSPRGGQRGGGSPRRGQRGGGRETAGTGGRRAERLSCAPQGRVQENRSHDLNPDHWCCCSGNILMRSGFPGRMSLGLVPGAQASETARAAPAVEEGPGLGFPDSALPWGLSPCPSHPRSAGKASAQVLTLHGTLTLCSAVPVASCFLVPPVSGASLPRTKSGFFQNLPSAFLSRIRQA